MVLGIDCTDSCKSNYHAITTNDGSQNTMKHIT